MKFEINQRVYIEVPQELARGSGFMTGQIFELYTMDGVDMAGVEVDDPGFPGRVIYIGQEKLNLMEYGDE